jgi:hypothetical protein
LTDYANNIIEGSFETFTPGFFSGQYLTTIAAALISKHIWWREYTVEDMRGELNMENIPEMALKAQTNQYMERLEGLRAEACAFLAESGKRCLDEALRSGTTGIRSASQVLIQKETK